MNKKFIIVYLVIAVVLIYVNISSDTDKKTGLVVNDYSYGIGRDDESGMTKVSFAINLHNNTVNSLIVYSVKPVMEDRFNELVYGESEFEVDEVFLEPDKTIEVEGILYFEHDGDKSFWLDEQAGLVQSFIVESDVIIDKRKDK